MSLEFVDTCILLYAYDDSAAERHDQAATLVERLGRRPQGALSIQVLQEFYVNLTRKITVPFTPERARARLEVLSRWAVHSPLPVDVIAATQIAEENTISFWDAMIIRSAANLGCSVVWTEGLNPGQRISGVEVRNPFA
jgi:predicted nucleic acid-binding protein